MKLKLILTIAVCMAMGFNTMAQEKRTKGNKESIIDYKTELSLTDEQVEKIKTVQREYLPKMKEARKGEDLDALKKLNEERRTKIEQLLSPEQLEKWKAIKEKMKADRQNPELRRELRDYQKQNIKPVLIEKRKEFDTELSIEEKQILANLRAKHEAFRKSAKGLKNEERMEKSKELRKETLETIKPIIDKHKPALGKLKLELEPSKVKWENDMEAIKAKHISSYKSNYSKRKESKKDMQMVIRFLLLNSENK